MLSKTIVSILFFFTDKDFPLQSSLPLVFANRKFSQRALENSVTKVLFWGSAFPSEPTFKLCQDGLRLISFDYGALR